jgi:prepilin-type N-terminal cleavage/methylation domain-containing protein
VWQAGRKRDGDCAGFTLIETVAALAIASVVIFAMAALLHNIALSFDRGTNRVTAGERLAVAAERLATDIGAAEFVVQKSPNGIAAAFAGGPRRVVFVGVAGDDGPRQAGELQYGQQVVSLSVEASGNIDRIVRRRGAWPGPRTPFLSVALRDEVVLLEGTFDAKLAFARAAPDGALSWVDSWSGEATLPRLVRLTVRDRATGGDLLGGGEFAIRADASPICAAADAGKECLSGTDAGAAAAQSSAPPDQSVPRVPR